jgi:RHS repeat-associated protein
MNVYSNAFNYETYFSGKVDTRTGQFGCQVQLATLYPSGPLEVSRTVTLSFAMLGAVGGTYGAHWRLSNTEFDVSLLTLTLLTGDKYQTQSLPSVGGTLVIKDRKLKDLVVKRADANTLHVIYKDGCVEVLRRNGSTGPYQIVSLLFENGEQYTWHYDAGGALERILNAQQQELLVLTYVGGRLAAADARVEGGRFARTLFTYTSGRLTRVSVPFDHKDGPASAGYTFGYTPTFGNGLVAINRLTSPMGGDQLIRYAENGHAYGNGQYIPRVIAWEHTPAANQPAMARTYTYSTDRNFTGYPFSGGFREGVDNLLSVSGDYFYWVRETRIDPASGNGRELTATQVTFNKFHLQTEESVLREGTVTATLMTYNMVAGQFDDQPANFQLPKAITKRYERAGAPTRTVIEHIVTDDYGNELGRTEASGIRIERSFYPVAGVIGQCPEDSHKLFVRYVRQERLIPTGAASPERITDYTHTRIPPTGASYFVLQLSCIQVGAFSQEHTYYDTPVELAGRLKKTSCTIDGLSLTSDFSYVVTAENLIETRTLTGREGHVLESGRMLSLVNRRLMSMTQDGGSTLFLEYEVSGRLTAEKVSSGQTRVGRTYAYAFPAGGKGAHMITTDAQGTQVITYFDGLGREVSEAQLMTGGQERALGTWTYDALGQCSERINFDYVTDGMRTLKSTYAYSPWGNSRSVHNADGRVLIDEYDPQLNARTEGVEGGQRLKTSFNEYNQPVKVERLDANNVSVELESRTYDNLGRCRTVLDVNKTLTDLTYDHFNRVLTVLQKPVDGTPQRLRRLEYALGTSDERVIALLIDDKRLCTRTYDSLGRMTHQLRGTGQASTWEYESGWMSPLSMVSPRGARQQVTYDKALDVQSKVEMTGLGVSTYQHDPVVGALMRSETNGLVHEYLHDVNGYLAKETQTANGTSLTALYSYSPGGRLLSQTAADNQVSAIEYDASGRFSRMTTGAMVVEQTYDTRGRPQKLTTAYDTTRVVTQLSYDSLGREAERRFEHNGVLLQVITQTYDANSLLQTRFLRNANSQVVTGETFTYDAYHRLKTYRCEGVEHPQDRLGRSIAEQDFSFDNLNNITRVLTTFVGGEQDICDRFFTGTDPTQLTRLTHTLPAQDVTLTYDASGNLQVGTAGQAYIYNDFEQLTEVRTNTHQYRYQYDAESRQALASRGNEPPVKLMYMNDRLDCLVEGDKKIRFTDGGDQVLARSGGVDGPQLHANDASGSVRGISVPGQAHVRRHYTPYGDAQVVPNDGKARTMADLQVPAFNGLRLDAASNLYFLGNGQRAFDADLLVFLQADPLGPLDEGGINCYAYGACNPVNMTDPSGLWPSWLKWVLTGTALVLSIVTAGLAAPGLVAAAAAYTTAATAAALATASGGAAAATATAAAATAAMVVASKAALFTASALGVVGGTLSTAALGIGAVDQMMGWDRSHHMRNLGWASLGFSIASWTVSLAGAYTSASLAYTAAIKAGAAKGFERYAGFFDTPIGSGLQAAGKSMVGLSYKFTDKQGITTFSKAWGVTRFALRTTNFGRAIEARVKAASPGSDTGPVQPSPDASAQPQSQATGSRLLDMTASTTGYYQAFRDEVTRIRQPILREMMQA